MLNVLSRIPSQNTGGKKMLCRQPGYPVRASSLLEEVLMWLPRSPLAESLGDQKLPPQGRDPTPLSPICRTGTHQRASRVQTVPIQVGWGRHLDPKAINPLNPFTFIFLANDKRPKIQFFYSSEMRKPEGK